MTPLDVSFDVFYGWRCIFAIVTIQQKMIRFRTYAAAKVLAIALATRPISLNSFDPQMDQPVMGFNFASKGMRVITLCASLSSFRMFGFDVRAHSLIFQGFEVALFTFQLITQMRPFVVYLHF